MKKVLTILLVLIATFLIGSGIVWTNLQGPVDANDKKDIVVVHGNRFPCTTIFYEEGNMVSIKDVAKEAGVAISTVSKVLNNYPNVSEATRKKVMDVVETVIMVVEEDEE